MVQAAVQGNLEEKIEEKTEVRSRKTEGGSIMSNK